MIERAQNSAVAAASAAQARLEQTTPALVTGDARARTNARRAGAARAAVPIDQ